jgi:hypothetical protein
MDTKTFIQNHPYFLILAIARSAEESILIKKKIREKTLFYSLAYLFYANWELNIGYV